MNITREELQQDIRDIIVPVVDEARRSIIKMINEDLDATNERIDNLSHHMDERFKAVDQRFENLEVRFESLENKFEGLEDKVDFTHKLLLVHTANPSAHSKR